ncbi:hypothetical protein BG60_35595 [Caballeronia zhejiangensis]|uniref:PH domain-containing protein n=1 Tax=Caballeronia zhejiangensis TaxID=871203 RepID=A0A656Q8H7_9BURK|nr:hypothetical protein BG60_35595 [Caballeronia zhejiangensis]
MGASSYTFACATPAETMEDWLSGIARALTFYGGVPQLIVPDFVPGNKIRLLCPLALCGGKRGVPVLRRRGANI